MEDATFAVSGNDTLHYRVGEAEKRLASLEAKNEQILKDLSANTRAVDRLIVLLESCPEHQRKARYADQKASEVERGLEATKIEFGRKVAAVKEDFEEALVNSSISVGKDIKGIDKKIDDLAVVVGNMQENNVWLIRLIVGALVLAVLGTVLI